MKKKNILASMVAVAMLVGVVGISGCGSKTAETESSNKMKVITTIYPVYDVAKAVGGDKVDISMLVAPGAEPHDWEPTAKDMKMIGKAKVFMYSGAGMEPVEKLLTKDILQDAKAVELAKAPGIELLARPGHDDDEDHDEHGHIHSEHEEHEHHAHVDEHGHDHHDAEVEEHEHHHHHHGKYDPHIWMSPINMIKETEYTAEIFAKEDPANAEYYKENAKKYIAELEAINEDLKKWRADSDVRTLVVSHLAFGYLAHQYDLKQVGIMGVAPEAEPTPDRMAKIVSFVKKQNVKAIFTEELVNQKLAKAIADESGAKIYMLNPLEILSKKQIENNENYISIMKKNISSLKEAYPAK